MKAGRELDALVAEKVMGIECDTDSGCKDGSDAVDCRVHGPDGTRYAYSTDIAAAYEVLCKMGSRGLGHVIGRENEDEPFHCQFMNGEGFERDAKHDSLPMAICLAALKALGIKA
jgi:hypothetical protein